MVIIDKEFTFVGNLKDGLVTGEGANVKSYDGSMYQGNWRDGKLEG